MKNRLKVLRAERDWTQAELADALDVSRQTINAIETGKFDPSLPLAFRAARLFGLRIEEIFHEPELDQARISLVTEIKKNTYV
jgi:putative transcriptional regulator